jgi:amino acid permease
VLGTWTRPVPEDGLVLTAERYGRNTASPRLPEETAMGAAAIELKKGLSQRHLTMIAMGGVIGAGLFVGSGVVISETGRRRSSAMRSAASW